MSNPPSFPTLPKFDFEADRKKALGRFDLPPSSQAEKEKPLASGRTVLALAMIVETQTRFIVPDDRPPAQRFKEEEWLPLVEAGLVEKRPIANPEKGGKQRFKLDATDAGVKAMAALVPVLRSICEGGAGKA